jgi:hypothetical protein
MKTLRLKLARWILGDHCPCYQLGYHNLCDYNQRSADAIAQQKARKE